DPTKIVTELPKEAARMGYYSTICLIFNRMIGVGIFSSASAVFTNTKSIGLSLILWMIGSIICLAGVFVFVELGLTIPRWPFGRNGEKISAIRSGDGLNYFNYMLKSPLFLATCMYGITFTILENTAGNSVSFATNILDAAHITETPGKVIGIALAANTFCCLLHALSRKWGILLNNFFGTLKLSILIFVVIIGIIWINHDVAKDNFDAKTSFNFDKSPRLPFRYAEAMIFIILPFGAFHQINYVVAEVREPRKVFPRAAFAGVITVIVIYMAVNILYAAIIPKAQLFKDGGIDVMGVFMQLTLGNVMTNKNHLATFASCIKAISAFGNLIVVTFTTARVKQEIAKEGILPYSLFFAENYGVSLSSIFGRKPKSKSRSSYHTNFEKTPAATLALHWIITTILVVAPVLAIVPVPYNSTAAYSYLTTAFVYDIDVVYFVAVAFGLLCLRFTPSVRWAEKSAFKRPWISITAASILLIGCLFPLIFIWVPDPAFPQATRTSNLVPWWGGQTLAVCFLLFAFLYWVAFRFYIRIRSEREGKTLHVKREPIFKHDTGGLTQIFEIVTLQW
ncbi:amino acid transporter, partial [Acephala macrosclerotiorum]